MTARYEQETTVSAPRDGSVKIYTSNPVHLRRLRADARVTELSSTDEDGFFEIPQASFDPLKGFRRTRRAMTEDERRAAGERLAVAREKRNA